METLEWTEFEGGDQIVEDNIMTAVRSGVPEEDLIGFRYITELSPNLICLEKGFWDYRSGVVLISPEPIICSTEIAGNLFNLPQQDAEWFPPWGWHYDLSDIGEKVEHLIIDKVSENTRLGIIDILNVFETNQSLGIYWRNNCGNCRNKREEYHASGCDREQSPFDGYHDLVDVPLSQILIHCSRSPGFNERYVSQVLAELEAHNRQQPQQNPEVVDLWHSCPDLKFGNIPADLRAKFIDLITDRRIPFGQEMYAQDYQNR
tara:strand:- start:1049 stop:1831 length:783 start_codon:yes stop_codon:yes gene_type:complete